MGHSEEFVVDVVGHELRVVGELDLATAPQMLDVALSLSDPVFVNLAGVTFIGSCGLTALIRLLNAHPTMRITDASPQVDRVLALTNTATLFTGATGT